MITSKKEHSLQNIQTILRIKPATQDLLQNSSSVIRQIDQNTVSLDNNFYKFDYISTESAEELYTISISHLSSSFLNGSSSSIISYGPSQSGKTFVLFGNDERPGIVQKILEEVFNKSPLKELKLSFFEIFQDSVFDLFEAGNLSKDFEEEIFEVHVDSYLKALEAISRGRKRTGGGKAHCLFTVKLNESKLVFFDLAGAERTNNSVFNGDKIKESTFINKSLTALAGVFKGLAHKRVVNFNENKLTSIAKDCFFFENIVVLACTVPARKLYWENMSTLKFVNKVNKLKSDLIETNERFKLLIEENKRLNEEIKRLAAAEEDYIHLINERTDNHEKIKQLEQKNLEINEKNCSLQCEISMLRKELIDMNKIENTDWFISSDSEENEDLSSLNKKKNELEQALGLSNEMISGLNKELKAFREKFELADREKELHITLISQQKTEIDELKQKIEGFQELSVLLSKQNYDLRNDLSKSKEISNEFLYDFSNISSTDSTKTDFHKILEEKEMKITSLIEENKNNEDSFAKSKEKHLIEINCYKKEIFRLNKELEKCRADNIKESQEAMKVLNDLKIEKKKLISIIDLFSGSHDKRKMIELKKINDMLLENLKNKGEKIEELQKQFKDFLSEHDVLKGRIRRKKDKLKGFRSEFFKIKSHVSKFKLIRSDIEKSSLFDCILELIPNNFERKPKSEPYLDISKVSTSSHY